MASLFASPALAQPSPATTTQSEKSLLILFDSSGSMWGSLPGNSGPKFALARDALKSDFMGITDRRQSGLIVFGPGCTSANRPQTLEQASIDQVMSPIARLNPRGKGPLGAAIETAMATLAPNAQGDVVIVHDGADNCGRNVCTLANQARTRIPGLRFHLLSVGVNEADARATRCIAETTQGRIFAARTASGVAAAVQKLATHLRRTDGAFNLSGRGAGTVADRRDNVGGNEKSAALAGLNNAEALLNAPPNRGGPSRIAVFARLGKDGPLIDRPLTWTITSLSAESSGQDYPSITAKRLNKRLAPGHYRIAAAHSGLSATTDLTVGNRGETRGQINLDAAQLRLETKAVSFADGLTINLVPQRPPTDASDTATNTRTFSRPPGPILIAPGAYTATFQGGDAKQTMDLQLSAGDTKAITPFAGIGHLQLALRNADDTRPTAPFEVVIEADAPGEATGRRVVHRARGSDITAMLPAATYYVSVSLSGRTTTVQAAVPANARKQMQFVMQTASITPSVRVGPPTAGLHQYYPTKFIVEDLSAPQRQLAWSHAKA
ncbi:MAG: hypothetical protein AAGG72_09845, partial [Pseudomonadota bacterium]